MLPVVVSIAFDAADDNGICASQTPGAAGAMTLNGALVSGGIATLASGKTERQVLFTFAADESGTDFVVTGTNGQGLTISETVAGTATTATTVSYFQTVTGITISAAANGAIIVGTNGVGGAQPIVIDTYKDPISLNCFLNVTGTINCTVQGTLAPNLLTTTDYGALAWVAITALASKNADTQATVTDAYTAIRLVQNSFTGGSATLTVVQAGGGAG